MAKRTFSNKKDSVKKRRAVDSSSRRGALITIGGLGLGASLASVGLFGKKLVQPFVWKNIRVSPLYLEGERMESKGYPLVLVEGWVLSEHDIRHNKI